MEESGNHPNESKSLDAIPRKMISSVERVALPAWGNAPTPLFLQRVTPTYLR
jgi:hypothetical protein